MLPEFVNQCSLQSKTDPQEDLPEFNICNVLILTVNLINLLVIVCLLPHADSLSISTISFFSEIPSADLDQARPIVGPDLDLNWWPMSSTDDEHCH